jgi:hypothetical protein
MMAAPFSAPQNPTSYTSAWSSTPSGATSTTLVAPFNALQSDMIIYLALRRASKAAIAYGIRRECANVSKLHISAETWEALAEEMIKAELRGHIKAPGADYVEDASAIVDRIQGCVETYGWHNSIIVRAADYMAVIETATTRAEIMEDIEKRSKARAARKKKAAKAAIKAIGSLVGDQVMARQQTYEAGLARADLGANLGSEDEMELNLFFLQYTSMIVDTNLADW